MYLFKRIRVFAALFAAAGALVAAGTGAQPAMGVTWNGSARIVAVTDYSLQVKYYWQNRLWYSANIPNAISGFVAAAVAPGGEMYVVTKPFDGSIIYYYSPNGAQWYPQTVAGPGATDDQPAIAVGPDGGVHIVARKKDGTLMYYYSPG